MAIEVKFSATVSHDDVKNLVWLKKMMAEDLIDCLAINTGPIAYRRPDGIGVVPASLIGS